MGDVAFLLDIFELFALGAVFGVAVSYLICITFGFTLVKKNGIEK